MKITEDDLVLSNDRQPKTGQRDAVSDPVDGQDNINLGRKLAGMGSGATVHRLDLSPFRLDAAG